MERERLPGTLIIWPGVAEELLGGKAFFVRAGVFKDVDVVLFAHVSDYLGVSWGSPRNSSGLISIQYDFQGEPAHAGANPWRGRSALDAVELMDVGWNFRREHEGDGHLSSGDAASTTSTRRGSRRTWNKWASATLPSGRND